MGLKIGLGFLFGAKDDGAKKALVSTRTGLADVDKGTVKATASMKRLNMAIGSMGLSGLNEINDKLGDLVSGNVNQLTSSLQGQAIAFDKSFSATAARAGIVGSEMKKLQKEVFGVAYGLNADADAAGEAVLAFRKLGLSEKDLGLDNMGELIKFANVAGIDMNTLAADVANLKKSYSFGDQTGAFIDDLLKQSTALGLGSQGLSSMTDLLNNMDDAFAQTLASEGPEAVKATTTSILKMASAMKSARGTDPQTAMTKSIELFKKLQEQANVLPKMMAGMESEFDPMIEQLAVELPGGFAQAFSLMQSDPAQFMSVMEKTVGNFRGLIAKGVPGAESDLQRLLGVLNELGPEFSFLADSGGKFGAALQAGATQAGVGMRQFANESYKSGLTLDDQIERAREGFKTRLFGLTQKETVAFVKGQELMYKRLGNAFQIAVEGGAKFSAEQQAQFSFIEKAAVKLNEKGFGPVVDKLLYLHRVGPMALGPMFEMLQEIAPLGLAMGAMGLRFEHFGKVLTFMMSPLKWIGGFLMTVLSPVLALLGPEVLVVAAAVGVLVGAVYLFAKALDGTLGPVMKEWSSWANEGMISGLAIGTQWLDDLTAQITSMDAGEMVKAGVEWFSGAFGQIMSALSGEMSAPASVAPLADSAVKFIGALGRALVAGSGLLIGIGKEIAPKLSLSLVTGLFGKNAEMAGNMQEQFSKLVASVDWPATFDAIVARGSEIRGRVIAGIVKLMDQVGAKLAAVDWSSLGSKLSESFFSSIITSLGQMGKGGASIAPVIRTLFTKAVAAVFTKEFWFDAFSLLWATLKLSAQVMGAVNSFARGLAIGLVKAVANGIIDYGPGVIGGAIGGFVESVKLLFSGLWAAIDAGAQMLFGNSIHTLVETDLMQILAVVDMVKGWFASLSETATVIVTGIGAVITSVFTSVYEGISGLLGNIQTLFYNSWDSIKSTLSGVGSMLGPVLSAVIGQTDLTVTGDVTQATAVKTSEASSRAKLLEQADNRALMVLMSREFELTRAVLDRIAEKITPSAALPVVTTAAGGGGKSKFGVTP